jgi:uncharacterized membrane protein YbaN (DUF454 family)
MPTAKRHFFTACGILSLVIGVLGIFLPLLPGTPFLILAAMCFSRGSERFHAWLVEHPRLGPGIRDWQENGVIRTRYKWLATVMMSISCTAMLTRPRIPLAGKIGFAVFAAALLLVIWTRNGRRR